MDQLLAQIPQQIVNGLTLGSVYALLALGYSMVYGILKMLNFAHGDVLMIGAFAGWGVLSLLTRGGAPIVSPILILLAMGAGAVAVTSLLGLAIERFAYRPLRGGSRLAPLISALGVSIVLENAAMLLTSARAKAYATELLIPQDWVIHFAGATVSATRLAMIGTSLLIMTMLDLIVSRTRFGCAMRATSQDAEAAEYMGIRTSMVISATFVLGSALAGLAGVMVGMYYMQVDFMIGFSAGLKAFTAAVLGGIGNFHGAMAGGLVLGLAESVGVLLAPPVYKDAIVFAVLILTLILKPAGLFGQESRTRA
ncbi:MAG: branched-chain amino acid ABC transporter permease [Clostridia bacterium]|nr:branched-chain amino acid ABC transporter permease [Clostridia bacterium]